MPQSALKMALRSVRVVVSPFMLRDRDPFFGADTFTWYDGRTLTMKVRRLSELSVGAGAVKLKTAAFEVHETMVIEYYATDISSTY